MKEIGDLLKATRKKQGLKLEDVAESTKIHILKLKAIEDGDKNALPAKVFSVGLIKSYARELKVDPSVINELCEKAYAEEKVVSEFEPTTTSSEELETQSVGAFQVPKAVVISTSAIVSLALATIIYFVVQKMNSYSEETVVPPMVMEEASTPPAAEQPAEKPAEPAPKEEPKEAVKAEKPVPVDEPKVVEPKKVEQPEAKQKVKAVEQDSDFEENNFNAPEKAANVVRSDSKLVITALEPIRAEIVWSDGYVQVMLLKSKEMKTLVFSSPIKLRVNNGGALQVKFNDDESKVPGKLNEPLEINFP